MSDATEKNHQASIKSKKKIKTRPRVQSTPSRTRSLSGTKKSSRNRKTSSDKPTRVIRSKKRSGSFDYGRRSHSSKETSDSDQRRNSDSYKEAKISRRRNSDGGHQRANSSSAIEQKKISRSPKIDSRRRSNSKSPKTKKKKIHTRSKTEVDPRKLIDKTPKEKAHDRSKSDVPSRPKFNITRSSPVRKAKRLNKRCETAPMHSSRSPKNGSSPKSPRSKNKRGLPKPILKESKSASGTIPKPLLMTGSKSLPVGSKTRKTSRKKKPSSVSPRSNLKQKKKTLGQRSKSAGEPNTKSLKVKRSVTLAPPGSQRKKKGVKFSKTPQLGKRKVAKNKIPLSPFGDPKGRRGLKLGRSKTVGSGKKKKEELDVDSMLASLKNWKFDLPDLGTIGEGKAVVRFVEDKDTIGDVGPSTGGDVGPCQAAGCNSRRVNHTSKFCAHHTIKRPMLRTYTTNFAEINNQKDAKLHNKLDGLFKRFAGENGTLDKSRWEQLCQELKLVDNDKVREIDVSLVFNAVKPAKSKTLKFENLCKGLSQLAQKKYPEEGGKALRYMMANDFKGK